MLEVTIFSFKEGTQCGPYNTTWMYNRVMYEKLAYQIYIYMGWAYKISVHV